MRPTEPVATDIKHPVTKGQKRKRRLGVDATHLSPYPNKLHISTFRYTVKQTEKPDYMIQVKRQDRDWALSCTLFEETPVCGLAGVPMLQMTSFLPKELAT